MLDYELLKNEGLLLLEPQTPIQTRDFAQLCEAVNLYLHGQNRIKGLVIATDDQMGWEDFAELITHLQFNDDAHSHIDKLAFASDLDLDSHIGKVTNQIPSAEVRLFPTSSRSNALAWIKDS